MAELLSNAPKRREERLVRYAGLVAEELSAVWDSLDQDYVRSDEFADLFEDVVEMTRSRRQMDKVEYYAAALANAATTQRPAAAERDRMIAALEELRPSHLRLLALIATTTDGLPADAGSGSIDAVIQHRWPGADLAEVKADWAVLARLEIVGTYPSGMMTAAGARDLTVRMQPFGKRFHDFITPRRTS